MKLSACTAVFGMADLKKIIDTSARLGYDAVEITAALHLPVSSSTGRRREVLHQIHDAGIVCSGLHYIFDGSIRLLSTREDDRRASVDYLRKIIDVAADLEAPTVIVGSGGKTRSFEPEWDREASIRSMSESIYQAAEYAAERNVYLAMEAINRYETNFLNTMQEATEFAELVNHPNVRTMADTYHMNIEEINPAESVRRYGHALQNLHLADSNRQAPGEGHFDFRSLFRALDEIGYDKYCSYEVFGLYPWKLWFDTFEEAEGQMDRGLRYVRSLTE